MSDAADCRGAKRLRTSLEAHDGFVDAVLSIMKRTAEVSGTKDSKEVASLLDLQNKDKSSDTRERVVTSRFLMGADDATYLRQGVVPLQTSNTFGSCCDDYDLGPSDDSFTKMQSASTAAVLQGIKEGVDERIQTKVDELNGHAGPAGAFLSVDSIRQKMKTRLESGELGTVLRDDYQLLDESNPKEFVDRFSELSKTKEGRQKMSLIISAISFNFESEDDKKNVAYSTFTKNANQVKRLLSEILELEKRAMAVEETQTRETAPPARSDDLARTRRTVIWNDALREACVSGDRLFSFVRQLSGVINEQVDAVCVIDENLLVQHQNKLRDRRSRIAERAAQEHMQLVKAVFSAVMKESGLILGIESAGPDKGDLSKLKVVSNTLRKQIADLAQGQGQEGFFGNSVRMEQLLSSGTGEITLEDLFARLQAVGKALQAAVSSATSDDQPFNSVSMDFLSAPRNSMMLRYKPEALAAIKQAFEIFQREFATRYGSMMTPISAYELMEGNDDTMSTHFSTFCAHMLVHSRMFGSSTAMYVGMWPTAANAQVLRISLERLCRSAYAYRSTTSRPRFEDGDRGRREYFERAASRQNRLFLFGSGGAPSGLQRQAYDLAPYRPSLHRNWHGI